MRIRRIRKEHVQPPTEKAKDIRCGVKVPSDKCHSRVSEQPSRQARSQRDGETLVGERGYRTSQILLNQHLPSSVQTRDSINPDGDLQIGKVLCDQGVGRNLVGGLRTTYLTKNGQLGSGTTVLHGDDSL
jgi:hypothetical protein